MPYVFETNEKFALTLDRRDPLRRFRARFYIPRGTIYMDGNSLGLLSRDAEKSLLRVLREWKTLGIRGWLEAKRPWFYFGEEVGAMAATLVGAKKEEVVLTGTTTVNLHSLVSTFYVPQGRKTKILADELNFPTDIYALRSLVALHGFNPETHLVLAPGDGRILDEKKIIDLMTEEVALVVLPSVLYRSGQLLDIPRLTREAHRRGILVGWDCSHSVGAVPHRFDEWEVDFAFWCSYKYLNAGPGAAAFLYVNEKHFGKEPALAGWFGYVKEKQFDMSLAFEHARSAGGWQISSPGILGSSPAEGALAITLEAGMERIREKSLKMTSYLMFLADNLLSRPPYGFSVGTPRDPERRGGHIALEHPDAMRIAEVLRARGVVPDYRPPNIIRIAPAALYTTYHDIWKVVSFLRRIIDKKEHEKLPSARKAIS